MAMQTVKIAELAQLGRPVAISDTQQIMVRALTLREMVELFIESRDLFLPLYAAGIDALTPEALAPFLLTAPDLVAKIIAIASDDPASAKTLESHMAATTQLIALFEVWKASVPDPKKATELLSEVTALLQRLDLGKSGVAKTSSPTTPPLPSSPSLPLAIAERTSGTTV